MSEKLIKGIIYVDSNIEEASEEMFKTLSSTDELLDDAIARETYEVAAKYGVNEKQVDAQLCTTNAIAAMTRYNFETGVNHNLIIPKESLSVGLVQQLEQVDIGQGLMEKYLESNVSHKNRNSNNSECKFDPNIPEDEKKMIEQDIENIQNTFASLGIPVIIKAVALENGNINHRNVKDFVDVFEF